MQAIYVDTCYFQGYLWGRRDDKENAEFILSKLESTVSRHPTITVKVPFIVVGELVNNLVRDGLDESKRNEITVKFFEKLQKLKADIIPPKPTCYNWAKILVTRDPRLVENAPTDCFIALCALCDPDSAYLLTNDAVVLESSSLKDIEKEMHENGERNREMKFSQEF